MLQFKLLIFLHSFSWHCKQRGHFRREGGGMIVCPDCGSSYRIMTSNPVTTEVREYYCQCKACDIRFLQYTALESFIVKNPESQPPNKQLQPDIARRKDKMLRLLSPEPKQKKPAMKFV